MRMHADNRTRRAAGFTLVEMLVVLAIISVMLGLAVPLVATGMRRSDTDRAVTIIQMTATLARSKAVETRADHDVVVEPSARRVYARRADSETTVGEERTLQDSVSLTAPQASIDDGVYVQTFTPSGGLNTGTIQRGFFVIGPRRWDGKATSGGASSVTANASWRSGQWANFYLVVLSGANEGNVALIGGNSSDTLNNLQNVTNFLEDKSEAWPGVASGAEMAIVSPDNIRRVVILSTTGQAVSRAPAEGL